MMKRKMIEMEKRRDGKKRERNPIVIEKREGNNIKEDNKATNINK